MDRPISNTGDYLIARAETELKLAESILDSARNGNDYYHEKAAAKLVAFHESEVAFMKHYVEVKLYYPDLAAALESHKPYLIEMWRDADRQFIELATKK